MTKTTKTPKPATSKGGGGGKKQQWTSEKAKAYWRRNLRLIGVLLTIWFVVSYVFGILFAELLYNVKIGQIPASFWFAQQGAIIVFALLIFVYCWIMDRVDKEFDVNE
jgi:putative solute:sodium symporter small subunit